MPRLFVTPLALPVAAALVLSFAAPAAADSVRVDVTPAHEANRFRPARALGAGVDRMAEAAVATSFTPDAVNRALAAGWGQVSYRLNTELHVEAWHWNPRGRWSDPAGRGYFVGDPAPGAEPLTRSYGYALPHRGDTRNEGTENVGYSRLTDGDAKSYWKSNPYLTRAYTGEDDRAFPEWLVVDLGAATPVDAVRIAWGDPFARAFTLQYWTGADAMKQPTHGEWRTFPSGSVHDAHGGTTTTRVAPAPTPVRFVRILLADSSGSCDDHGAADRRNCVGYAVRELSIGTLAGGRFRDRIHHSPDQKQTLTYCSSVDPWHTPADRTADGVQTGFDLFYGSGITRQQPAMIPVAVVYDNPDNAAAEIAWLEKKKVPISWVELGEEPDGQYMTPEHYAALYLQFAAAIHKIDPTLKLGGPAFTGQNEDIVVWPDGHGSASWLGRFLAYLRAHNRMSDLAFFSFEHYPYLPCTGGWDDLYQEPQLISHIMQVWRDDGLPRDVPMLVTEVNLTAGYEQRLVDLFGALWLADYVGAFFTAGGAESFFFHYLPESMSEMCGAGWGCFSMLRATPDYKEVQPTAQFFAAQLITQAWAQPGDAEHRVFRATGDVFDAGGRALVTAYALARPDGSWSLLLVNKDPARAHAVAVVFRDESTGRELAFSGDVAVRRFGPDQYAWHAAGALGHADPDGPPATTTEPGGAAARYTLGRSSLTVLSGRLAESRRK